VGGILSQAAINAKGSFFSTPGSENSTVSYQVSRTASRLRKRGQITSAYEQAIHHGFLDHGFLDDAKIDKRISVGYLLRCWVWPRLNVRNNEKSQTS
jgi:hypothetical protein